MSGKNGLFQNLSRPSIIILVVALSLAIPQLCHAQETTQPQPVELNGDTVEYSADGQIVTARGRVIIKHPESTLMCDEVEFNRATSIAVAKGNVRLINPQGEIAGDALTFNFSTMTGDFHNARITSHPYYGAARKVSRVSASKIVMEDGYLTTSDFDKPEYRLNSSKIEVYPGDKIISTHNKVKVGPVPVAYMPKYVQNLKTKESQFNFTPGYDSDWGIFLLTTYRYYVSENFQATFHLDWRELLDIAEGVDVDYVTQNFGKGVVRLYYTKERPIDADHIWDERRSPTPEHERFKAEWRHRWQIDDRTDAILQYYKLSDARFLQDYFENEFDHDQTPPTFFVLTRALPNGTLSVRSDVRVNRFVGATERLPEIRYDLRNQEIAETGLYYTNLTTLTSLSQVDASPTDVRRDTNRIHTDQQISYPMKISFLEFNPFVGTEETFYSRAEDRDEDRKIRDYYKAGASLQTKFYRIFDVDTQFLGEEINRMRHIITPSLNYQISKDPSIDNAQLMQIDEIDSRMRTDVVTVGLENKLQVKRDDDTTYDFLRALVKSDYYLENDPRGEGFEIINTEIDLHPARWLSLYFDSGYDIDENRIDTANFDIYINSGKKWQAGLGRRYNVDVDDQITTSFAYVLNPKWKVKTVHRFNVDDAELEEQQYILSRDLHSWIVDFHVNEDQEETEFVVIFTLKAFPDMGFDFGTSFDKRESGSSPSEPPL